MEFNNPQARSYLFELFNITGTNLDIEISMYDVGAALGLEKPEAGQLAEELIIAGWVELRNLSGGISINAEGLRALDIQQTENVEAPMKLTVDPVLGEQARAVLESVIGEIRSEVSTKEKKYQQLEEIIFDIKTLQVQLLSPNPKTAIVREVLRSISSALSSDSSSELGVKLGEMIKR